MDRVLVQPDQAPLQHRNAQSGRFRTTPHPIRSQPLTPNLGCPAMGGSSWLNLVERWFGELTTKKLQRGTHRSVRELNKDIRDWIGTWNDNPRPYVWTKTADQILESIARYCARINDSRH